MSEDIKKELFNEKLLSLRKTKNIELNEIAEDTKINIRYLEAIESGDFDALPNIYARLFIKAYVKYLNADVELALKEYEELVNIKPKKIMHILDVKKENNIKNVENQKENKQTNIPVIKTEPKINNAIKEKKSLPKNNSKFNLDKKYFFSPSKIFQIVSTFLILAFAYFLISYLSKEHNNITLLENENAGEIKLNKILVDESPLNKNDFNSEKLISQKTFKLKNNIKAPYIFQIVTKQKTKIYISHDNDQGERIEDCNIIAKKDSLLKFENNNSIYFDLWNAQDVQIQINNNPISKYLGDTNALVRGAFQPENKKLYLKFYSH